MPVRPELALLLALAVAGCAPQGTVAEGQPTPTAVGSPDAAGEADELAGYLELAATAARSDDGLEPMRRRLESALDAAPGEVAPRMRLATLLACAPASGAADLERARALLGAVGADPRASGELRRLALVLEVQVEQRLRLETLLVERSAEVERTRASLERIERSGEETELENAALRRALASSQTKLRELVRIEQAIDTSAAPEAR